MSQEKIGIAGQIAKAFIKSKLTPLIILASIVLGLFAVMVTPREEEPQIIVPMADVFVQYPGASAEDIEARVTKPMEKLLWEIKGVEYVYSVVKPGMNMTIVRFYVGQNQEDSIVKLYNKLMSNYDRIPQGVSPPLLKVRSIDDVPILSLTMSSKNPNYTGYELRRVATEVADTLKKGNDVSEISVIGGQKRQVKVTFDPIKLNGYNLSAPQMIQSLQKSNFVSDSGKFTTGNNEFVVQTGGFLDNADDVQNLVIGTSNNIPVYLRDVATVEDTAEEPSNYVFNYDKKTGTNEAVTIALSKKKGANATNVAEDAIKKIEAMEGQLIPHDINITVTRNYGETAKDKSDELLEHMLIATVSVIILIALFLGKREAAVVAVAVPVTLALTLLISFLMGYTLNRVTLFALIFSIGILVDDAIVVVENIHRHFKMGKADEKTAIEAVDEVGNPTILATFTVVASLLPMAFVSGLMGPYMRPIPVGASAAMVFSLLVAFIVSPWLSYIVLKNVKKDGASHDDEGGKFIEKYKNILTPLIEDRNKRMKAITVIASLLGVAILLIPLKAVQFKMLPFDNKSELQLMVDMPAGTTLEQTAMVVQELGKYIQSVPEVVNYQSYIGTSAPYNFNGLVRHYFLRQGSNEADIQINFLPKNERNKQSHEIAKKLRPDLKKIADKYNAKIKLAEIPPGPPVISTLVAEIYGPDGERQIEIAKQIKNIFNESKGVVDVDWLVEADKSKITFEVDKEKAALNGIGTDLIAQSLQMALGGASAGLIHLNNEKEPVEIFVRMPVNERANIESLRAVNIPTPTGQFVPLSELVKQKQGIEDKTIYHKNLKRVTYVTGDVAGEVESPVYAVLDMQQKVGKLKLPEGELQQFNIAMPWMEDQYSLKWDGEWHITLEVFRDMGIAFAAVLLLIYVLVVAWFKDFITPLVIMAPIPLTLVGILPGHLIFGAFFTATSMIGFIALSGIIVRNSILLVDFIQLEQKNGVSLKDAVIKAGAVRFRPIVLTALAVVVGSFVMFFDPIFQGLAIAMMFGAVVATILTLIIVPILYYEVFRDKGE